MLGKFIILTAIFLGVAGQFVPKAEDEKVEEAFKPSLNRILLKEGRVPVWKLKPGWDPKNQGPNFGQPEQVHLAYGGDPSQVIVTWLTFDDTESSAVEYGTSINRLDQSVSATIDHFEEGEDLIDKAEGLAGNKKENITRYTHRALIKGIKAGVRYYYHVGSQYGWSSVFFFNGLKPRPEGGYKYAVYGDMGNANARSLGKIQKQAQSGDFDMVLHVGDFAYNLESDNGKFGDQFNRQIEPVAAYVPYMTAVGNHEARYNFTHYINRYTMPNTPDNLFYSFDLGDVHFIALSTEFYYYINYGIEQIERQFEWLKKDLEKANKNRKNVPWIIVLGHRPLYCSAEDPIDCAKYSLIRDGLPLTKWYGLENQFYKNGVDLVFGGHMHYYERNYPVYARTVYNGTKDPYSDPPAPVYITSGSAGCMEYTSGFVKKPGPWSAFRSQNYGFGRMQVFNSTHLYFEQTLAGDNTVEDKIWLIKRSHGPYKKRDLDRLAKYGTYVP